MVPYQARVDEMATAYLGYTDSKLDTNTMTSPTESGRSGRNMDNHEGRRKTGRLGTSNHQLQKW